MTIDSDSSITRNIAGSVNGSGFTDLDHIDRSGFKWGEVGVDQVDQVMDYLFGINRRSGNSELLKARLRFDHDYVREKYGLPKQDQNDPESYFSLLTNLANERGISILGEEEYMEKYGEEMTSDGFCDDHDPLIFLHQKPNDTDKLRFYNKKFEHEIIHAMQIIKGEFLKNPYELSEYEALVGANLNLDLLEKDIDSVTDHIFCWALIRSVLFTYQRNNKQPPWLVEAK